MGEEETQSLAEESDLDKERRNRWEGEERGKDTSYELKETQEARKNGTDSVSVERWLLASASAGTAEDLLKY